MPRHNNPTHCTTKEAMSAGISEGDAVNVIGGNYEGETGRVLSLSPQKARVKLSSGKEVQIMQSNIQLKQKKGRMSQQPTQPRAPKRDTSIEELTRGIQTLRTVDDDGEDRFIQKKSLTKARHCQDKLCDHYENPRGLVCYKVHPLKNGYPRRENIRKAVREQVFAINGGRCFYQHRDRNCPIVLTLQPGKPNTMRVDHEHPFSAGGIARSTFKCFQEHS